MQLTRDADQRSRRRRIALGVALLAATVTLAAAVILATRDDDEPQPFDAGQFDADVAALDEIDADVCAAVPQDALEALGLADAPTIPDDSVITRGCLFGSESDGPYLLVRIYPGGRTIEVDGTDVRTLPNGLRAAAQSGLLSDDREDHARGRSVVFSSGALSGFVEYVGPADASTSVPTLRSITERLDADVVPPGP